MSLITPYLRQRLTLLGKTAYDKFGRPLHGEGFSVPCRFSPSEAVVRGADGQEITARAKVLLEVDVALGLHDHFSYEGERYQVVEVRTHIGLDGRPSHKGVLAK